MQCAKQFAFWSLPLQYKLVYSNVKYLVLPVISINAHKEAAFLGLTLVRWSGIKKFQCLGKYGESLPSRERYLRKIV